MTGGMEVGVQRSQNPQYYGVWRTVVGQKCPVREVQWASGGVVHHQGVRGTVQQQGERVVQGRSSREVQGSWRGEKKAWQPALYHRFVTCLLSPHSKLTLETNFQFYVLCTAFADPGSKICRHLTPEDALISSMCRGVYATFGYTKFCR